MDVVDLDELKQKATKLRKERNYGDALALYKELWRESGDEFDGAGLLHCLRKIGNFEEAIPLADVLISKHIGFEWCRYEVIWTYIQGIVLKASDKDPIQKVIREAGKILQLNPDEVAIKAIVFKVMKLAHLSNRWDIVNQWIIKVNPQNLSDKPRMSESGREEWSDRSLWYHYRAKGLIETGQSKEAVDIVDAVLEEFPRQRKFFLRLKALGLYNIGKLPESEVIYRELCQCRKPDWWILHEYGKVLQNVGSRDKALKMMCQSALSNSALKSSVSLLTDIGALYKDIGDYEKAMAHFMLCRYIREEQGWNIPDSLANIINDLGKVVGEKGTFKSIKDSLLFCRNEWRRVLGVNDGSSESLPHSNRKSMRGLLGKVSLGKQERLFCFIMTEGKRSFFCIKSDLPQNIQDGDAVTFDAIPSFDRKKNMESWKASNIHIIEP